MNNQLKGLGVALVTPFDSEGGVDFAALEKLVHFVSNNGADYLVALGTTAEVATLTLAEKQNVLKHICQSNIKKLPIVLGIGGNNTRDVVTAVAHYDFTDVAAVLSVAPYYNKPSQQGLYFHYKEVAAAMPVPLILYNVPGRTGVNLSADTTLRLAHDQKNIVAIKEASANLQQVGYILKDKPKDFLVISGDDGMTLPMIAIGASGVISVAANIVPQQMAALVKLSLEQKNKEAVKIHLNLLALIDVLFEEGNPTGVKAALSMEGMMGNYLRLPLVAASNVLLEKMKRIMPSK
ncbi:MAG: 4-hydroxy-tetrahydrodipicolinate synthase [Bacteroidales bacterium]